jgi:hypothetical protein
MAMVRKRFRRRFGRWPDSSTGSWRTCGLKFMS